MPTQNKFAVLVINSGSSSVKFTLLRIEDEKVIAKGIVERIGLEGTQITCTSCHGKKLTRAVTISNTQDAVSLIVDFLVHEEYGAIEGRMEVTAIGHRVVHGGEKIHTSAIIDQNVKSIIKEYSILAPLHNPHNLEGIEACESIFSDVPQVAVFDTAFHSTLPEHAFLYGLPYRLYAEDGVRRYGFHGISHHYVSYEAAIFLDRPLKNLKIITCHLGNGSSITAVDGGMSVDTSMGFTPLEGTIMGTRCGTIDVAIVTYLMEYKKLNPEQINTLLNTQSGFLGMAEIGSSDVRNVLSAMEKGNPRAAAAINVFVYQIRKYLGAYTAVMNGLDVIVFTGGIGENSSLIRKMVCNDNQGLETLGINLDPGKNDSVGKAACEIQTSDSRVSILVIPTDEEKEIARQTVALLGLSNR